MHTFEDSDEPPRDHLPGDLIRSDAGFTTAFSRLIIEGSRFELDGDLDRMIPRGLPGIIVSVTEPKQVKWVRDCSDRRACYIIWPHIIGWEYDNMVSPV